MITRRGFMGQILALGVAPAIVRYDSLMRPVARDVGVVVREYEFAPIPGWLRVTKGEAEALAGFGDVFAELSFVIRRLNGESSVDFQGWRSIKT